MKRITFAVIILNISLFFTACAHPLGQSRTELLTSISSREDRAYNETMSAFLDALNRNDENAIYALFSSRAYESDPLLKEDIHTLVEMYPDGTDEVFYGLISGSNHWYNEGSESFARSNCTLLADGSYFECSIELLYEYTEDPSQLGIVRMDFYTADEYCINMSSEESHYNNSGLTVHNSQTLEVDFRLIDNFCMNMFISTVSWILPK